MGIYIPHMKLPERCEECPFFVDEDFTWCGRANYNVCDGLVGRDSKPNWCDLVNVPPHGRLIDGVALFKDMERKGWWSNHDRDVAEDLVLDAPTIIPAEEGQT